MKQLITSLIMGTLCITVWIVAAPILNSDEIQEKESKVVVDKLDREAQTLTML
ncbi:hypothetical protein H0I23_13840 [Cellulophaga sp. HaHaR_3_176]|uniref:hypothetical protein n=1 Tax=Cellulophaga sp. HaHaR_3_176 TaxID=1942464 RepID=UPI001C1F33AA|nr:hypothetical protein [Cellulophaga sp. HaHaR_3_176]QWX83522.1 hypothetical protein H0I23_13840 [Cellulophaga sp. HaHaR_3_176]